MKIGIDKIRVSVPANTLSTESISLKYDIHLSWEDDCQCRQFSNNYFKMSLYKENCLYYIRVLRGWQAGRWCTPIANENQTIAPKLCHCQHKLSSKNKHSLLQCQATLCYRGLAKPYPNTGILWWISLKFHRDKKGLNESKRWNPDYEIRAN